MNTTIGEPFTAIPAAILPEPLESSDEYRRVLALTERLFPGSVAVRRKQDPEFREEYLAFVAGAHGTLDSILSRDAQWHRECGEIAPSAPHLYRLSINVQP